MVGNIVEGRIRTACSQGLATGLVLAALAGCAGGSAKQVRQYVPDEAIAQPGVILIYDFAVHPGDVVVDTLGPGFAHPADTGEQTAFGREVANSLAEQLVAKLGERGIPAERASGSTAPPLDALLVKGQFVSIDEGDQLMRTVIGFGAGSSKLRVHVQVYQATPSGLRRLSEAEAEAHGSKKPGMAGPVGVGAAAGHAASSAVISGGMTLVTEVRSGVDADAGRLAEQLAERAESFYRRQGWL